MALDDDIASERERQRLMAETGADFAVVQAELHQELVALAVDFATRMRRHGCPGAVTVKLGTRRRSRSVEGWYVVRSHGSDIRSPDGKVFVHTDGSLGLAFEYTDKLTYERVSTKGELSVVQQDMARLIVANSAT